jgi:hypothetical protein
MPEAASGSFNSRQIEIQLMEILRLRQHAWITADEEHREVARQRFVNALHTYIALVFNSALPQELAPADRGSC